MSVEAVRAQLAKVIRASGDLVSVEVAARALGLNRTAAAQALARWAEQGQLRRIRRGLYTVVPLAATPAESAIEDSWRLVPKLFAPGYVGGVTAAQHWDLTEQLFRSTFVFTAKKLRKREVEVGGVPFVLRHRAGPPFGTRPVWRGAVRVEVSDLHRTIVDMLDDPSTGGGIRHVDACLEAYLARREADLGVVLDYARRLGNGSVYKRLGFLLERHPKAHEAMAECRARLTAGAVKLDPAVASRRLVTRWRLWVPDGWKERRLD